MSDERDRYAGRPVSDGRGYRPAYRTADRRFNRPSWRSVRVHSRTRALPRRNWYRPLYTRWWVHPYYRWTYATVACTWFDFYVDPWATGWAPPRRTGWQWVGGHWSRYGYWVPGHWSPVRTAPVWSRATYRVDYVYVPGWWVRDTYVEGYWRSASRSDGRWVWVDGRYVDGVHVWGHWEPLEAGPNGYSWENGYWDGETWVGGFWRPEHRPGFRWVSSWYDHNGVFNSGYWEPGDDRYGHVWIPGWFDGSAWIAGYWVPEAEYGNADVQGWQPEGGVDDGWSEPRPDPLQAEEAPLAVPID